jgi:7,8-dihydropterin-6-yl-methyl-4-(beta-D-ribofuranosyl)aminobenzene 5'-phosphate synthase
VKRNTSKEEFQTIKGEVEMVKGLKLTVVVEDASSRERSNLQAKHGLCFLVEVKIDRSSKTTLMMDTGPSPDVTIHNFEAMNLNLSEVKTIVLSHGHYDHVGGLLEVLKRTNRQTVVIGHTKIFNPKFAYKPHLTYIGAQLKPAEVEATGCTLLLANNPITITDGVMTTGEIERKTMFEKGENFKTVDEKLFHKDIMQDDQALVVNVDEKGLVVISGCAHAGIVNTVKYAQKITGVNTIYGVFGGFHLTNADDKRIEATIDELHKLDPKIVGPCHCTGSNAVNQFKKFFGKRCMQLRTGDVLDL